MDQIATLQSHKRRLCDPTRTDLKKVAQLTSGVTAPKAIGAQASHRLRLR
jgi:hypothetical protein